MSRKVFWTVLAATLVSVSLLSWVALRTAVRHKAPMARRWGQPIPVQVAAAVEEELPEIISAPVTLRPVTERIVNPQIAARVTEVLVKVGDVVAQGQVLARLDATNLMEAVLQAEANLREKEANLRAVAAPPRPELVEQARIAVEQARQQVTYAQQFYEQQKVLAEKRVKAAEAAVAAIAAGPRPPQIEEAKAVIESARQLLQQTEEQVEQARADVQQAELALQQARSDRDYWEKVLQTKRDLYQQKLIARQEVEDAEKSYRAASTQAQVADTNVQRMKASLRAAMANRDRAAADLRRAQENLNLLALGPKPEDVQRAKEELEQVKQQTRMDVEAARNAVAEARQKLLSAQQELRLRRSGPRLEEIAVARAALHSARVNLQNARAQLRKAVVRSPVNGVVTARNVDPGEIVSPAGPPAANVVPGQPLPPGAKLGAGLFLIAEIGSVDAVAQVEETKIKRIRVGQRAEVTLDAFPSETYRGTVRLIESNANPATRTVAVYIALSRVHPACRPNMQGVARLAVPRRALVVPSMAVITAPQRMHHSGGGSPDSELPQESAVFVIESGKARLRRVRLGAMQDGKTEILSGLRRGERVAVYDLSQIRDGDRVAMRIAR
ncbi:MAG: efflux RND transporter periplasmic adaptor subunit [Abditibacteriales bacterium]|nr:efflux RND transporter periplasmic adaptor subunit [Abditibacteriales bacterium]MDW8364587.1 efflux RND transporter periplasmic adaptor subunit [Abditibacteriales bacterium]